MNHMNHYPLEGLLRLPVEWLTSVACALGLLLMVRFSDALLLTSPIRWGLCLGLSALGVLRFFQGYRIFRYQHHLKRLPFYAMSSNELPINNKALFLGKGFKWEPKHTQRLYDVKQHGERFLKPNKWARPLPPVGGNPAIHGVEPHEQDVVLKLSERVGHTMILGTTRVGKTRLL